MNALQHENEELKTEIMQSNEQIQKLDAQVEN